MNFTVLSLVNTLGEVRPFIVRSREALDVMGIRFAFARSRFSDWYNSQSEWVICGIIEFPDRNTFETCFGW